MITTNFSTIKGDPAVQQYPSSINKHDEYKQLCLKILQEFPDANLPKIILELLAEIEGLNLKNKGLLVTLGAMKDTSGKKILDIIQELEQRVKELENPEKKEKATNFDYLVKNLQVLQNGQTKISD
jgi:hypothetical protein